MTYLQHSWAVYGRQLSRTQGEILRKVLLPFQERIIAEVERQAFGEKAADLSFAPRHRYAYLASLSSLAKALS